MALPDQPLRILLAEDTAVDQRIVTVMLKQAGYTIEIAQNGSAALEAHRSDPYDVILMDCHMPEMDGLEATRRIRQLNQKQPVIIAVTANACAGQRETCLSQGMDDYLSKPFTTEQLIAILHKAMLAASAGSLS